jgi:hypothetical protein
MERFKRLPSQQRMSYKILKGHLLFRRRLDKYMPQPCTYITVLRDPVERIISLFYYVLRTPSHYLYEKVVSQKMDLGDFMKSRMTPALSDSQTDMLATVEPGCGLLAKCLRFKYPRRRLLKSAKKNIMDYFSVVGVVERYDEFLVLLKLMLGWDIGPYMKENVTKDRPTRDKLPADVLELIREMNLSDMELYRFAEERMDELIARQGAPFWEELKYFRTTCSSEVGARVKD